MANITVEQVYALLDAKAPFHTQLDFDNAGFLVGRRNKAVRRILVALDVTPAVVAEAVEQQVDLIVGHHPIIWEKCAAVTDETTTGALLLRLIAHNVAVICAHTNLDAAPLGVNHFLAAALGLLELTPLEVLGTDEQGQPYGIGRIGLLPHALSPHDFALGAKAALSLPGMRFCAGTRPVRKVAVGGGACASLLPLVYAAGCDAFLTSEIKHDQYLEAQARGLTLIDAGHHSTEALICPVLCQWLSEAFPQLTILPYSAEREVYTYL